MGPTQENDRPERDDFDHKMKLASVEREISPAEQASLTLQANVEELDMALGSLGSRLKPVINVTGRESTPENTTVRGHGSSPMVSMMATQADRIQRMTRQVYELTEALEV